MCESLTLRAGGDADGSGDVTWVDVDVSRPAGADWLRTGSGLGEAVRQQLLHPGRSSRRESLEQGLLVVLCAESAEAPGSRVITLALLLERNRVLTVRSEPIEAIDEVRRHVQAGTGPRTPLELLAATVVAIKRRLEPVISRLSEDTGEMEDRVLGEDAGAPTETLSALRRDVFRAKRYVSAFETVLTLIRSDPTIAATAPERRALAGAGELLGRYLSTLEDCRERTVLLHDLIEARVSRSMSRATYNLTIVATVFLPLTFVTGLLGMNVAGIPESHSPWGFWIVVIGLTALAVVSWVLLRWSEWFVRADGAPPERPPRAGRRGSGG